MPADILLARMLFSFKVKSLSRFQLFATPWTVAHQAPPSMEFFRQEYWSWLPLPYSKESCQPRYQTFDSVSCTGRQILYHCSTWEAPKLTLEILASLKEKDFTIKNNKFIPSFNLYIFTTIC